MGPRGKGFGTSMVEIRREKMEKHIQASSAAEMEGAREGAWASGLSAWSLGQQPKLNRTVSEKGNCKKPSSWSLLKTFQVREAEMRTMLLF